MTFNTKYVCNATLGGFLFSIEKKTPTARKGGKYPVSVPPGGIIFSPAKTSKNNDQHRWVAGVRAITEVRMLTRTHASARLCAGAHGPAKCVAADGGSEMIVWRPKTPVSHGNTTGLSHDAFKRTHASTGCVSPRARFMRPRDFFTSLY